MGRLGRATCTVCIPLPQQTSQVGNKCTITQKQLRAYCHNIYTVNVPHSAAEPVSPLHRRSFNSNKLEPCGQILIVRTSNNRHTPGHILKIIVFFTETISIIKINRPMKNDWDNAPSDRICFISKVTTHKEFFGYFYR